MVGLYLDEKECDAVSAQRASSLNVGHFGLNFRQ